MKKKRNKKWRLRSIAVLLAVSMIITAMPPMSSLAKEVTTEGEQTTHEAWSPEELQLPNTEGDLPLEELGTAELSPEDTPEIVSSENIQDKGHVNRLWEQENDLNTIVFQNRDGTKTAYHYSDPVKYTDKDGKVKDKKNKLSETANGEYTNAENDINAYFPKKLHKNKGVELTFGKYTIEMAPNINGSSGASRQTGHDKDSNPKEYVEYPNVFADGVSVRYTPAFGGYKEDIILSENVGKNRFEFKLTTNGLSLVRAETGNYYLAEPLTGEYITALGNVVVYDNTGVESEGYHHYYEVTTLTADQQYLVTVVVDERYLESEDTEYPVYVDPTLTVMPQGKVQDAAIYSSGISFKIEDIEKIKIGRSGPTGVGRGLYNFPILNFTNDFILMYGNQISSATLNLYALPYSYNNTSSYDHSKPLSMYEYNSEWSRDTVKWNNTDPDNCGTFISRTNVTSGWTSFDISYIIDKVKTDADYTMNFKGVMIKADEETGATWKKFASTSYGPPESSEETDLRPYIEITYNNNPSACAQVVSGATYYVKNYNGEYLDVYNANTTDNTKLLTYAFHGNANQQFKITHIYGGEYEIAPQHTMGKVLSVNTNGEVIIEEDCNKPRQRWYIYYKNGDYHIVNKQYNSGVMGATYDTDYVSINNEYEYCCWELEVYDPCAEILSTLSRDEYYYITYPSGIGSILHPMTAAMPMSPKISTLPMDKKLLSIPVSRQYKNSTNYDSFRDELNLALGTNYSTADAEWILTEYKAAINDTFLMPKAPPHLYTPESVQYLVSSYLDLLHTFATFVTFKVAAQLNPFDANGNIKFKPDKYTQYYDSNGNPIWPGTNGNVHTDGFMNGYSQPFTFREGDTFDRFGNRSGRFVAPVGTSYSARSLAPGSNLATYEKYIVNVPFDAYSGFTAPWFNQAGGGVQYKLPMSIQELIDIGYISVVN